MAEKISGKEYWFITGASAGLGKILAETVLKNENVFVTGLARHASLDHPHYHPVIIDLSQQVLVNNFKFPELLDAKKIVLVNNAGALGEMHYVGQQQNDTIARTYFLNAVAPHILSNKFIQSYGETITEKVIVNISSGAASTAYDGWSMYCATKAALEMMSRCMQIEQRSVPENKRTYVLSIAPGVMDTAMQSQIRASSEQQFSRKKKFEDLKKNNQLYEPQSVANELIRLVGGAKEITEPVLRIIL